MSVYQSMYLCLMCLFVVVLLVGIVILIINYCKEHKRFQYGINDAIDDIKYTSRYAYNDTDKIWSAISKMQEDIHAMCERIVTEPAKPIDPVDIPIWVADPCPVCGHTPQIISDTDDRDAMVFCKHCDKFGYTAGGETIRGAVYMWNKTVAEYLTKVKVQEEMVAEVTEKTCNNDYCDI